MIVEARIDNDTHQMRITRRTYGALSDKQRYGSRPRILCNFNLIDSAKTRGKYEVNSWSRLVLAAKVASVAILRISAILSDV